MRSGMGQFVMGVVVTVALSCSSARAGSLTYYVDVFGATPATTAPIAVGSATLAAAGAVASVLIPRFVNDFVDPTHQNWLSDVSISLFYRTVGSVGVANFDVIAHSFINATSVVPLSVSGPSSPPPVLNASATSSVASGSVNSFTRTFFGTTEATGSVANNIAQANLPLYEGLTALLQSYAISSSNAAFGGTEVGGSGDLFFGGTAQAGGILAVTYTFDPRLAPAPDPLSSVPEPVTLFLTAGALLGLGFCSRPRRKTA